MHWVVSIKEEIDATPPTLAPARAPNDAPPKLGHVEGEVTRHNGGSIKKVRIGLHKYSEWRGEDMYDVKREFLVSLLRRRQEKSLDEYVTAMREIVEPALECYEGPTKFIGSPNSEEFVQMMLFDSCFIVELLRIMGKSEEWTLTEFADDHPFRNLVRDLNSVKHDLICIENQLPLMVLQKFFEMSTEHKTDPRHNLNLLVKKFSKEMLRASIFSIPSTSTSNRNRGVLKLIIGGCIRRQKNDHPTKIMQYNSLLGKMYSILRENLDYHKEKQKEWFHSKTYLKKSATELEGERDFITCATDLEEVAGIGFKKASKDEKNILNIDFDNDKGEMLIPPFKFTSTTKHLLTNLMEYEKQYPSEVPRIVNEYVKFMQCLLHSEKDVQLLRRGRIISNWTGDDQHVSSSFKHLGSKAEISTDSPYEGVIWKVNTYYGSRRKRWMAKLRRNYFNSPWSFISFLAALLLLLLTVTQTVFAILSYTHPPTQMT